MGKSKRRKKIHHGNTSKKRNGVTMPTTDKIDFKAKMVTWEKEYFIKINGSIQKEDIMITNIYVTRGCKIHE